jgi:hypothetical protein
MLERRLGLVAFMCAVICLLPACAHFSSSGRQQLAYARYVRKQSHNRVKMTTKYKKVRMPKGSSAEPKISGTSESPLSVNSSEAQPSQSATTPAQSATTPEPQGQ